ncbi:EAL domain-containing protein [Anaerobacillus sp. CMMVII]|uniref:putative bifunctional diguanylate cyclase/phosphodiesterase n=1 Tax=Anaerobacillus sp. CMMVII TaxID=2755588 RepID=UPI0021B83519|nr:EAL domain-containing protein [Anaerobacillus sp. CMMVII]MCT8139182.1 EAL domain-containing protein [Anaerobacillus sp. CMMVII]
MITTGRIAVLIPIINVLVFFGWSFLFKEDEWLRTIGAVVFPVIGSIISFFWIARAFQKSTGEKRTFWLLLGLGILFNVSANLLWFYSLMINGITFFSNTSYLLWVLGYIFFLLGLTYKTKTISTSVSNSPYLFNLVVFMTVAIGISIHYLIKPIWLLWDNSFLARILTISYPVTDLSILFLITYLYYLSKYTKERKLVFFLVVAFFFQILADSSFLYLLVTDSYRAGSYIDSFWVIAIMFIGFAALYAQKNTTEDTWKFQNKIENHESLFPYGSAIILLFFVLHSYLGNLNALIIGLSLAFLMIIIRQLFIMKKNKNLMSEFEYLAYHDSLTGLKNRAKFNDDLSKLMERAKRSNDSVGLILFDLDRFKYVNDTLGHYTGDMLLIAVSERLKLSIEGNNWFYRIGGDEFVIILPGKTEKHCMVVAETILKQFTRSFIIDNHDITITPSIGISLFPDNGKSSEQLFKMADTAMYLAKENGSNDYCFYNKELNETLSRKVKIENDLRKAIEKNQLLLHYQPIVDLQTSKMIGIEALIRWQHPEIGSISPTEFIPIAEETGQIVSIGEWVLKTACTQNLAWQKAGHPSVFVSVNVSVRQFQHSNFIKTVKNVLLETGLDPSYLELEITESILQNVKESIKVLKELRDLGVKTGIDDFGTGYSSLHILKELPIDTIKIDKIFIDDVSNTADHSIVKAIIDIGLNLNLRVIAEGIEQEKQASKLTQFNCTFGQGYLFLKPVNAMEFEKILSLENSESLS